jgi:predicted phage gp36 major capsid-like protein
MKKRKTTHSRARRRTGVRYQRIKRGTLALPRAQTYTEDRIGNFVHRSLVPRMDHIAAQVSMALDVLNQAEGMAENLKERMRMLESEMKKIDAIDRHPAVVARRIIALEKRLDERARETPSRLDIMENELRSLRSDLNKWIERYINEKDDKELATLADDEE